MNYKKKIMKRENRTYFFYQNRISLILFILIQLSCIGKAYAQTTGFGNITINNTTTNSSKGKWTTVGTVYTFTPTAIGSNVNMTDIQTYLGTTGTTEVIISTACAFCTESGIITVSSSVTSLKPVASSILKLKAEKNININAVIDLGIKEGTERIDVNSPSIEFISNNGNIISSSTAAISNNPITGQTSGYIKFTANNGYVQIMGAITTTSSTNGGPVTIIGNAGVTISANITTSGGSTGILSITDNNSSVSISPAEVSNQGQTNGIIAVGSFEKLGTGVFQLKGANVWSGNTTISAGYLKLGANNSVPITSSIVFNGGYYQPNGFNSTVKTFRILADSYITFDAAQSSTITFDSVLYNSTANKYLTIVGWQGFSSTTALSKYGSLKSSSTASDFVTTNGALQNVTNPGGLTQYGQVITSSEGGTGGLKGKIYASSILTRTPLATTIGKIQFLNGTTPYTSIQISTKEIIPGIAKQP